MGNPNTTYSKELIDTTTVGHSNIFHDQMVQYVLDNVEGSVVSNLKSLKGCKVTRVLTPNKRVNLVLMARHFRLVVDDIGDCIVGVEGTDLYAFRPPVRAVFIYENL